MFKKKCYLCGGKLSDGRCVDCGLRNKKSNKKTYRLNYSATETRIKNRARVKDWQEEKEIQRAQKPKKEEKAGVSQARVRQRKTSVPDRRKKSLFGTLGFIITIILVIAGAMGDYAKDKYKEITTRYEPITTESEEYIPYEYTIRELSDEGDVFETILEPGEYKTGVHIPEGRYEVFLEAGRGSVYVDDYENSIYMSQSFGDEAEYDEVREWIDVRLYQGSMLIVSGNVRLRLYTENAQSGMVSSIENPLTEEVLLKAGETVIAGEDFPEGVYDFQSISDWTGISYRIPLHTDYEDEELNFLPQTGWVSADELDSVYRNVVLPAGTAVCAEDADGMLIPSKVIETEDYDSYYNIYRY